MPMTSDETEEIFRQINKLINAAFKRDKNLPELEKLFFQLDLSIGTGGPVPDAWYGGFAARHSTDEQYWRNKYHLLKGETELLIKDLEEKVVRRQDRIDRVVRDNQDLITRNRALRLDLDAERHKCPVDECIVCHS